MPGVAVDQVLNALLVPDVAPGLYVVKGLQPSLGLVAHQRVHPVLNVFEPGRGARTQNHDASAVKRLKALVEQAAAANHRGDADSEVLELGIEVVGVLEVGDSGLAKAVF